MGWRLDNTYFPAAGGQTDLFTFVLKRQKPPRVLSSLRDDYSRFITGYGLHATHSGALVLEVLRGAELSSPAKRRLARVARCPP